MPRGERDHPRRPADTNHRTRRDCNGWAGFALRGRGERRNALGRGRMTRPGCAATGRDAAHAPHGQGRAANEGGSGAKGEKPRRRWGSPQPRPHVPTQAAKRQIFRPAAGMGIECPSPSGCRAGDDGQRPTAHRRPAHCANGWDAGRRGATCTPHGATFGEDRSLAGGLVGGKGCGMLRSAGSRAQPALYRTRSAAPVSLQSDNRPQPEREGKATGETPTLSAWVVSSRYILRAGGWSQY